jgi:hypothetical protein
MGATEGLHQRFSWSCVDEKGRVHGLFRDNANVAILIEVGGAGNPPNPGSAFTLTIVGGKVEARSLPMAKALAELMLLKQKIPERQEFSQVLVELGLLLEAAPPRATRHAR